MAYGTKGCENIWLAWDGEDQAVLGYFFSKADDLVKSPKGAVVICHGGSTARELGNRSGTIVDVFSIEPGEGFIRPFTLPHNTQAVEVLVDDVNTAHPIKAFELVRDAGEIAQDARFGNIVIALPEDETDEPDGRFVWSDRRIHHVKRSNGHIGWAGYFRCWTPRDADADGSVVCVSSFRLEVPHLDDAIEIIPVGYDLSESTFHHIDPDAPATIRASEENERIQNAVFTIEGSPPVLHGLYFMHVSAHRQRANEWSRIVDIDPGAFQAIADNLFESYRKLLLGSGEWRPSEIDEVGHNLVDVLTSEHRWFELQTPDHFVDVLPNQTGSKVDVLIFDISAGDHLVFYDTMGRKLLAGQHVDNDGILAFTVGTEGLQLLRGVYSSNNKKIAEIDAHRPAKKSLIKQSKYVGLPPTLATRHSAMSAPLLPFEFIPLKVSAAFFHDLAGTEQSASWSEYQRDTAAWLLADTILPGFWKDNEEFSYTDGSILKRALAILGRENALAPLVQLEDQIIGAFAILKLARSSQLQTCVLRIDGVNPASDNVTALTDAVNKIDELLSNEEFREWLSYNRAETFEALCTPDGGFKTISKADVANLSSELKQDFEVFEAFQGAIAQSADSARFARDGAQRRFTHTPSEESLLNLIASLTEADTADKKMAGRHFETLIERFGRNAYYRGRVASAIYEKFPELMPNDSKKLMEYLRDLLVDAGCKFDMKNFDDMLLQSVAENMQSVEHWLLPNAVNTRRMAQIELDNVSLNTPTDEQKKAAVVQFAAAPEMQKTWDDIRDVMEMAEEKGIRVPARLRRLMLLWPRESTTTLSECLSFEHKHRHILGQRLKETYGYDSALSA